MIIPNIYIENISDKIEEIYRKTLKLKIIMKNIADRLVDIKTLLN